MGAACGDDAGSHDVAATGDSTTAGSGGSETTRGCQRFTACGGEPEGAWQVRDVCLNNGKELFASVIGPTCGTAYRSASVSGDGSYALTAGQAKAEFTLNTAVTLAFDDACIQSILGSRVTAASQCANLATALSKDPNFASVACEVEDALCVCDLAAPEAMSGQNGAYRVAGEDLIIDGTPVPFCVEGETLTIQPTVEGAVVTITLGK